MNFTLDHLMSMSPCEFERVREGGEDFRHALSNAVLGHLTIPAGWNVNAEYRGEFGGLFPVQCRFNPDSENDEAEFVVCVCSPGEISPTWTVILLAGGCRRIRIVRQFERFEPERINPVLTELASFNRIGITAAELITAISKEGAL